MAPHGVIYGIDSAIAVVTAENTLPWLCPHAENQEKVTLAKIPMCAVSAVFIWSNHVHYQLLNCLPHVFVPRPNCLPHVFVPRPNCLPHVLVPRPFENGSSLFVNLEFQKLRAHLRLLGYYSYLIGCL